MYNYTDSNSIYFDALIGVSPLQHGCMIGHVSAYIASLPKIDQRRAALDAAAQIWPTHQDPIKQELIWLFDKKRKQKNADFQWSRWKSDKR
jgi:hypothetical protein